MAQDRAVIPRVIHQVWVGGGMPVEYAEYAKAWRALHPGWRYRLWTDADLRWLRHQDLFDAAERLAPRNVGQFRADIARLEVLLHHGGIYIDADMEPVRQLDPLIEGTDCFAAWHFPEGDARGRIVMNALMGAVPGHPVFAALVSGLPDSVRRHRGLRCNRMTGPRYITGSLRASGLIHEVTMAPAETFYPYQPEQLDWGNAQPASAFPDSWAVHRWHNRATGNWAGRAA